MPEDDEEEEDYFENSFRRQSQLDRYGKRFRWTDIEEREAEEAKNWEIQYKKLQLSKKIRNVGYFQTSYELATLDQQVTQFLVGIAMNKNQQDSWNKYETDTLTTIQQAIDQEHNHPTDLGLVTAKEQALRDIRDTMINDKIAIDNQIVQYQKRAGFTKADPKTQKSVDRSGLIGYQLTEILANTILLNQCILGSAFYNRVGQYIKLQSVVFTAAITPIAQTDTSLAALVQNNIRTLIVYDKAYQYKTGTNKPTYTDVCQGYAFNGALSNTARDPPNPSNQDRFEIVYDNFLNMSTITQTFIGGASTYSQANTVPANMLTISKEIILNKPCYFGSNDAGDNITTGALWLILKSDIEASATVPYTILNFAARTYFTDNDTPNNDFTKKTHKTNHYIS